MTDLEEKMRQGLKRKATSPIPDESLSDIGHNLLFKPEVHVSRLSPTHLEMTKVSPVKVITDDPLVIQPAVVSFIQLQTPSHINLELILTHLFFCKLHEKNSSKYHDHDHAQLGLYTQINNHYF